MATTRSAEQDRIWQASLKREEWLWTQKARVYARLLQDVWALTDGHRQIIRQLTLEVDQLVALNPAELQQQASELMVKHEKASANLGGLIAFGSEPVLRATVEVMGTCKTAITLLLARTDATDEPFRTLMSAEVEEISKSFGRLGSLIQADLMRAPNPA